MPTTDDPRDPRLTHGVDAEPTEQAAAYLVLSDDERKKGLIRPVRRTYVHRFMTDGSPVPREPWVSLPQGLKGCGAATTMSPAIAQTYARDPKFYGATYCTGCRQHLPVSEFIWDDGSVVGS